MTLRVEISGSQRITYTQTWDVDNRLIDVISGTQHTQFFYDADGGLVKKNDPRGTTAYIGADDEITWLVPTQTITTTIPATLTHKLYLPMAAMGGLSAANGTSTTYYRFNGARVAMRTGSNVYWLHGDHLGSASLVTSITGTVVSEMRYYPFGEVRWISGTMPTDRTFTGQRLEAQSLVGSLMDYGARFYVPSIGRFLSADSIVPQPGDPQSLNRYSYAQNSPLNYSDPTGHCAGSASDSNNPDAGCWKLWASIQNDFTNVSIDGAYYDLAGLRAIQDGLRLMRNYFGSQSGLYQAVGDVGFIKPSDLTPIGWTCGANAGGCTFGRSINVIEKQSATVVHELAHIYDFNNAGLSLRGGFLGGMQSGGSASDYGNAKNCLGAVCPQEDFAESVTWAVLLDGGRISVSSGYRTPSQDRIDSVYGVKNYIQDLTNVRSLIVSPLTSPIPTPTTLPTSTPSPTPRPTLTPRGPIPS